MVFKKGEWRTPMFELEPEGIAWLAGLLEGEGSFQWNKSQNIPTVRVGMTDLDIIERIAIYWGSTVTPVKPPLKFPTAKMFYVTTCSGEKAKVVMRSIRGHMGERRGAKIDELLARSEQHAAAVVQLRKG